jgi:hypothetical protein
MKIAWKIAPILLFLGSVTALRADNLPAADRTSPGEMQTRATQIIQQIQSDHRYVLYLQAQARRQRDVIKLNCVNDKLIQMKAEQNIGDSANDQLQATLTGGSGDRSEAFSELLQAGNAIRDLRQQAAACLGEAELTKQESGGTFTSPQFPDDPTVIPFDVYTEPPAYASPFN